MPRKPKNRIEAALLHLAISMLVVGSVFLVPEAELAFLPLRAGKADLAMVIDAKSGEVLRMSNLRPWKE